MVNRIYISLLAILLLLVEGCDVMDDNKLKVYNDTQDTIFCLWTTGNDFNSYAQSPLQQSKEYNGKDSILTKNNNILFPNDSSIFSNYDWEHEINSSKNKQLTLFFFKLKTLQERNWKELQEKVICDKKITLTHEDLEKLNWKVVYDDN